MTNPRVALTSVAGACTINWSLGCFFRIALTENTIFAFSGYTQGQKIDIEIVQGAAAWTAAWPGSQKWPGGTPPVISAGAAAIDKVSSMCVDSATPVFLGEFKQAFA